MIKKIFYTRYLFLILFSFTLKNTIAQTIKFGYDSLGRITQVIYPDSNIIKYAYDASGNRIHEAVIESPLIRACPQGNISFFAGIKDDTKDYQWQVDSSNGFKNIIADVIYSGVDSSTLTLNNAPTNWYNYKYRCTITDGNGQTTSPVFTLKFSATWIGISDASWANTTNWSCGSLPDSNTDVIINSGSPHFPQVGLNVTCRSLEVQNGATILVKTGYRINITGKGK